jgi:hypothetical protein
LASVAGLDVKKFQHSSKPPTLVAIVNDSRFEVHNHEDFHNTAYFLFVSFQNFSFPNFFQDNIREFGYK